MAYHTHPEVVPLMGKPPMDEGAALRSLEKQAELAEGERGHWHAYAVIHRADAKLIGEVGFFLPREPDDEADLGFAFHPNYQGKGYAAEAARAVIRHAFEGLGLTRLTAGCDVRNAPSAHLIERLGFRRVGQVGEGLAFVLSQEEWDGEKSMD